jgi:hypothetical protein
VTAASGISGWGWAAFGGFAVLLCLVGYGVVRLSRRPQRLGEVSLDWPVRIGWWRAKAAVTVAVMWGLVCATLRFAADDGNAASWVVVAFVLLVAAATTSSAKGAFRGQPAIVLDREGLREPGSGRYVRWSEVRVARVEVCQGAFDEHHDLIVEVKTGHPPVEVPLDELAMDWREVMQLVGELSGRPTHVQHRKGVRGTSR